jgi:DNA-binding response OmpR family regulator
MRGIDRPVVFITGQDRESSRRLAEQIGAAGYFIKPFHGRDLVETVKKSACH